ncbi:hypothetical protein VCR15J2_20157 [Vibrio coralliirubri]|nr:hypothetical protein VCR15J2_20157 [Vibrio coralliirubri]
MTIAWPVRRPSYQETGYNNIFKKKLIVLISGTHKQSVPLVHLFYDPTQFVEVII